MADLNKSDYAAPKFREISDWWIGKMWEKEVVDIFEIIFWNFLTNAGKSQQNFSLCM